MTASVSAFLAQVRQRGAELPPALTGTLLLAAVRLSEQKSHAVRPELLLVGQDGALELLEGPPAPLTADPYAAPELRRGSAPPRDPRVLVYAAGALGYELVTLFPLADAAGDEVKGPLAPVVRKALSPERKGRYRNLEEMAQAIEEIQSRPSEEEERLILAAVASTSTPAPPTMLAKVELKKAAATSLFEADPGVAEAPEPEPADPIAALRAEVKERRYEILVLESRVENLARLGARLSALEERLKGIPPRRSALILAAAAGAAAGAIGLALIVSLAWRIPGPAPIHVSAPTNVPVSAGRAAATEAAARGDKALRSSSTREALAAFESALKLDPSLPGAHRGMGMVYALQGKNAEAKAEYQKYLQLAPDAPDADQIKRLLAR